MSLSLAPKFLEDHHHFEVSRCLWNAIADADVPVLRQVLAPKTVWHMPGRSPLAGTYVGVDAVLEFMAHIGELCDDLRSDLIDVFVSESGAVLRYAVTARRGPHELQVEQLFLTRIRDGRVEQARFVPLDQEAYDRFWMAL